VAPAGLQRGCERVRCDTALEPVSPESAGQRNKQDLRFLGSLKPIGFVRRNDGPTMMLRNEVRHCCGPVRAIRRISAPWWTHLSGDSRRKCEHNRCLSDRPGDVEHSRDDRDTDLSSARDCYGQCSDTRRGYRSCCPAYGFAAHRDRATKCNPNRSGNGHRECLYDVTEVVDEDTIKVRQGGGRVETVRLSGMDTPKVVDPRTFVLMEELECERILSTNSDQRWPSRRWPIAVEP